MCVQGVCRFDYGREGRVCPNCRAKAEGVFQVTYLPQMKTPTPTRLTQDMLFNRYINSPYRGQLVSPSSQSVLWLE